MTAIAEVARRVLADYLGWLLILAGAAILAWQAWRWLVRTVTAAWDAADTVGEDQNEGDDHADPVDLLWTGRSPKARDRRGP